MSKVTDLVSDFVNGEEQPKGEATSKPATIRKELVPEVEKIQKKSWTFTVNYLVALGLRAHEEQINKQPPPKSGGQAKAS